MPAPLETFSDAELAKFDPILVEQLDAGSPEPLAVTVRFAADVPAQEDLLPLGLGRMGNLVFGKVTLAALKTLAGRSDVARIEGMGSSYLR
jgi:predicted TPR repeat methyltransferase